MTQILFRTMAPTPTNRIQTSQIPTPEQYHESQGLQQDWSLLILNELIITSSIQSRRKF